MTYAWPDWEFVTDTNHMKLQHLQNKFLRITGNFPRRTPTRDMHVALKIPYMYDFITQQAEVTQNHENANIRNIGQGEVMHRKAKTWRR
jgi:hypothetical protein